jgi:nitrogen fixation protein NifU and related proteins
MNNNDLDIFLDKLQDDILNDAYNAYGKKGYDRWLNPKFCNTIANADVHATLTGECGDTMEIFLCMDGEKVVNASYCTNGCASSSICGSFAAELAIGKSADEILDMTGDSILDELGRFPKEEQHCAHLAISTVKEAINKYMRHKSFPNKI